ncbi:hypothetical protein [Tahibacter caeni]|uniref:hypothetical protein n=1 Tax=Tahibacter caeni TaxID=1453545 RepID=UPI0021486BDA|nr:hypothetical protein [Tahibacter caeni]
MLSNVLFWLGVFGIVLSHVLRGVLVARLQSRHPQLYRELGRPSPVGRFFTFVSRLRRRADFPALDMTDRRLATALSLLSVLIHVLAVGFLVLTFSAQG